jgi:hypothetical protein
MTMYEWHVEHEPQARRAHLRVVESPDHGSQRLAA